MSARTSNSSDQPRVPDSFALDADILQKNRKTIRAYNAAIQAFNSNNWDATMALCGKVLDSAARSELSFNELNGGQLSHLVEKLAKHFQHEHPVLTLATALKHPKGLGAHFDLDRESTREVADLTLDIIESFINYHFVFRLRVQKLNRLISGGLDDVEYDPAAGTQEVSEESPIWNPEATARQPLPTPEEYSEHQEEASSDVANAPENSSEEEASASEEATADADSEEVEYAGLIEDEGLESDDALMDKVPAPPKKKFTFAT